MFRVWHGDFGAADALDWNVEIIKGLLHNPRTHFGRDAAGTPAFIDNHRSMCAPHRCQDCFSIERPQGSKIEDLAFDSVRCEDACSLQSFEDAGTVDRKSV